MKRALLVVLLVVFLIVPAYAVNWIPPGDINLYNYYSIFNWSSMSGSGNITTTGNVSADWFFGSLNWSDVQNKFITAVDNAYIYMSGTIATFNESKLNNTIDARDTNTHVAGDGVYLYNDSTTMSFNESKLNRTVNQTYVPYTSAWQSVDIGDYNMTATYFIGDGSQLTGIEQGELILYFLNASSPDITGNKTLSSIPNTTEATISATSLPDGNTLLGEWISSSGVPDINLILGNMRVHVDGKKTSGTKNVQFFYKIYRTDASGNILENISTSEYTDTLTNIRVSYRIWALTEETMFNSTDRIMVEGYAYVTGTGSAPSVEAYIQGESKTRLVIPVGGISVEKFIPYENSVKNVNLGAYNFSIDNNTLFVDSTNDKVGIGTTSPSAKLDVAGTLNLSGAMTYYGANPFNIYGGDTSGDDLFLYPNSVDSGSYIQLLGGDKIDVVGNFSVDTNTLFVDSTNDKVGIGTTSPSALLDVAGNMDIDGTLTYKGTDPFYIYGGDTTGDRLFLYANNVDANSYILLDGNYHTLLNVPRDRGYVFREQGSNFFWLENEYTYFISSATTATGWTFAMNTITTGTGVSISADDLTSGYALSIDDNGTELFCVKGDGAGGGNVGIGTTSPQNTLSVIGDANITGNIYHGGNITSSYNASFGMFNNGTCIVIGDLKYVSEC